MKKKTEEKKTFEDLAAGSESLTLWNEIKDKDIEMFSLPRQSVSQHISPVLVEPTKLYVLARSSAVLPALETALGKKYHVELLDKYLVVSRA